MSGGVPIPEEAWKAFWDATDDRVRCNKSASGALDAAAPLIVAAEIERLLEEHAARNEHSVVSLDMRLRSRASVLRGEGQTNGR